MIKAPQTWTIEDCTTSSSWSWGGDIDCSQRRQDLALELKARRLVISWLRQAWPAASRRDGWRKGRTCVSG